MSVLDQSMRGFFRHEIRRCGNRTGKGTTLQRLEACRSWQAPKVTDLTEEKSAALSQFGTKFWFTILGVRTKNNPTFGKPQGGFC